MKNNGNSKAKFNFKAAVFTVVLILLFSAIGYIFDKQPAFITDAAEGETPELITSREQLIRAITNAESGGIVFVGGINDFDRNGNGLIEQEERITISKSITIKSGKPNGEKVKFSSGSFIIDGPRTSSRIVCRFENIVFDGGIDAPLSEDDWRNVKLTEDERFPERARYAVQLRGNADAFFTGCEFTQYAWIAGGALWSKQVFDSYSSNDYSFCILNITLIRCEFTNNQSLNGGGAVYLQGTDDNIFLNATDCVFEKNTASSSSFFDIPYLIRDNLVRGSSGGGAIYAGDAVLSLKNCRITENRANWLYGDACEVMADDFLADDTEGGGICCSFARLYMTNCVVSKNMACNGGGIALKWSKADIDGCVIAGNTAATQDNHILAIENCGDAWTMLNCRAGMGGGLFIHDSELTAINTSIHKNSAVIAYGGISVYSYSHMDGIFEDDNIIGLVFCTYANNTSLDPWKIAGIPEDDIIPLDVEGENIPLNIWSKKNVSVFGSIIADEYLAGVHLRQQRPNAENNYNYFNSFTQAVEDGVFHPIEAAVTSHYPLNLSGNDFSIPSEALKTTALKALTNGRFENVLGNYYVGSNYKPSIKLRLNAEGSVLDKVEITFSYGEKISLPEVERKNYNFAGWIFEDGTEANFDKILFGGDIEEIEVYAKWEQINAPLDKDSYKLPGWAIALIVLGSLLVPAAIIAGTVIFIKKREAEAVSNNSEIKEELIIPITADSINRLSEQYKLTAREKEIVALIVEGKSQSTVAAELYISPETVKSHVKNIYGKLDINSRFELLACLSQMNINPKNPEDKT